MYTIMVKGIHPETPKRMLGPPHHHGLVIAICAIRECSRSLHVPEALEESDALVFEAHVARLLELASLDINHESCGRAVVARRHAFSGDEFGTDQRVAWNC